MSTKTLASDPGIIAPKFTTVSLTPDPSPATIYTTSKLILQFVPSANIASNSKIVIVAPEYLSEFDVNYFSQPVTCEALQTATSTGMVCSYDAVNRRLTVEGAWSGSGISQGSTVRVRLGPFLNPAIISNVV